MSPSSMPNGVDPDYWILVEFAACSGSPNPEEFDSPTGETIERLMRTYCDNCWVRAECRDYAMTHRYRGLWGYPLRNRNAMAKLLRMPKAR